MVANHVPWRGPIDHGHRPFVGDRFGGSCSTAGCLIPTGSILTAPTASSCLTRALDAVIVSHAHNDHIGRLPCLIRAGYAGPIYTTPATGDIANVMLRDSARIQREEVRNAHLKYPQIEAPEPLFDLNDVEWMVERLKRIPYQEPTKSCRA